MVSDISCSEIGMKQSRTGAVMQVKILGVVALIDDGETDWKLIVISIYDPLAPFLECIADVEKHIPGASASLQALVALASIDVSLQLKPFANISGCTKCALAEKRTDLVLMNGRWIRIMLIASSRRPTSFGKNCKSE